MKDILINVLFIIVMLFFTQIFLDWQSRRMSLFYRKLTLFVAGLIGIIFCMWNSIEISPHYVFDIRVVPFVAGSLYGGPVVTIGLYIALVIGRLVMFGYDSGAIGTVISYGLITIALLFLSKNFYKDPLHIKYIKAFSTIWIHVVFSRFIFVNFFEAGISFAMFMQTALVKMFTALMIILIVEMMRRYFKLKNQLLDLEKMELVYHLSASISHEVRNGLTSARGFIQLTQQQEEDPQKQEYLRIATSEIDRTESIIRDFLTFAKPSMRKEQEIDLAHLVNHTVTLIEPLANMHSIVIHKDLQPITIKGDQNLLQQSLLNILKNAIEAMSNGGVLDIRLFQTDKENMIIVKDTGTGMTTDQMERLGTPYFSTKGQKGTGLGMMVAYRVIKELGGNIQVSSAVNNGTTFTVSLPRQIPNN